MLFSSPFPDAVIRKVASDDVEVGNSEIKSIQESQRGHECDIRCVPAIRQTEHCQMTQANQ